MKKLFLLICILFMQQVFANSEVPDIPLSGQYIIEYNNENVGEINTDIMKNKDRIEAAKSRAAKNSKPKFYFDEKEVNQQRILDYMNQQSNSLLPSF